MILVLGEILFDMFPDGKQLGGAPFNFAYHLKMLGFDTRFVSRVGQDDLGSEILHFLDQNGFHADDIQIDPKHPTGTVDITFHPDGGHAFSIVENTAYDHMVYDDRLKALFKRDWKLFYTGTLIQRNMNNVYLVQKILSEKTSSAVCFCDINLRPGCYTVNSIHQSLDQADIVKINQEELDEIAGVDLKNMTKGEKAASLMKRYALDLVILTCGSKGSHWYTPQMSLESTTPEIKLKIQDTVGAGDAYAAMSAAGFLTGLPPEQILPMAQEFAGCICEIKGAIPEDRHIYQAFKRRLKR